MFQRLNRGGWPYSQPPNVPFEVNEDSEQAEGLAMWMPWGGGTPGARRHVDRIGGLAFTEGGTPVWVNDGRRGWSMEFDDAQNEYLQAAWATDIPITMACWAWLDDLDDHTLMSIADVDNPSYHALMWFQNALRAYTFGTANDGAEAATQPVANTWFHACGIWASTTDRRLIWDGIHKGTNATDSTVADIDNFRIGATADSTPFGYLDGRVMDARIYKRALTDTEVWQLYANPWELWRPRVRRVWSLAPVVRIPRPPAAYNTLAVY